MELWRVLSFLIIITASGQGIAHEWLPTYPKLTMSHVPGVYRTQMRLFNSRKEINYYKVTVHDGDMDPVPFALTANQFALNTIQVGYMKQKKIDIYIRDADKDRAVYIFSKSRPLADSQTKTMLYSRICSKIK